LSETANPTGQLQTGPIFSVTDSDAAAEKKEECTIAKHTNNHINADKKNMRKMEIHSSSSSRVSAKVIKTLEHQMAASICRLLKAGCQIEG
jgi:hypothetical protein